MYLILIVSFILLVAAGPANASEPGHESNAALAEVDGVKITVADLDAKNSAALFQARNVYYEAERKVLEDYIGHYLLERQARKENLTVDQLIERQMRAVLPADPTEESLRVYYEGVETTEPYEAVRDKILDHIRQTRRSKALNAYVQSLRKESTISVLLSPPRLNIPVDNAPLAGDRNAPVTLIEYGDFECPYCQQVYPDLKKLQVEYKGKLAFAFKDMPLPIHSHAQKAAEAARCAEKQGKYWQYHDALFSTRRLDIDALKDTARSLNLDGAQFERCLDSGEEAAAVNAESAEGQRLGLTGTPTFFLNGRLLSGALGYDALRQTVEDELAAAANRSPKAVASK